MPETDTKDVSKIIDTKALADAFFERRSGGNPRRPERSLREVAPEIGVSVATLSRVEREYLPDVETYVKVCRWLHVPFERFITG